MIGRKLIIFYRVDEIIKSNTKYILENMTIFTNQGLSKDGG